MTNALQIQRLILQIERDLVAQGNVRVLMAAANGTIAKHREELRTLRSRAKAHLQLPSHRAPAAGRPR